MERRTPRSVIVVLLACLVLLLAACSQSNDPATWEEAEAQGDGDGDFPVRTNFIDACELANADQDGMSPEQAAVFCECSFGEVREQLSFEEFEQLDDDLRADPEDLPSDVEALFDGCVSQTS